MDNRILRESGFPLNPTPRDGNCPPWWTYGEIIIDVDEVVLQELTSLFRGDINGDGSVDDKDLNLL